MSGILNKVKEVVTGQPAQTSTTGTHSTTGGYGNESNVNHPEGYSSGTYGHNTTTSGPHNTDAANRLDPRVDSDRDGSHTSNTGYGSSGAGASIAQKLDPRIDSGRDSAYTSGTAGYGSTTNTTAGYSGSNTSSGGLGMSSTAGPHNSSLLNKLDPRVDSDLDGSRTAGNTGNYGSSGTTGTGNYSSTGHTGTGNYSSTGHTGTDNYGSTGTGPGGYHQGHHGVSSLLSDEVATAVDPRHETSTLGSTGTHHGNHGMSDRFDHYTTTGAGTTHHQQHGTTGGLGSTTGTGYGSSTTAGPHDSNMANKLDPRVDSDRDGSRTAGTTGTTGYGSSGTTGYGSSGTTEYGSSGLTGTSGHHGTTGISSGYDTTGNTTGASGTHAPHKSSLLNKLDPRVDNTSSDYAPGTGNAGGAETMFSRSGHGHPGIPSSEGTRDHPYAGRDTSDAAQVPPSAFGREAGHHMSTGGSKSGGAI